MSLEMSVELGGYVHGRLGDAVVEETLQRRGLAQLRDLCLKGEEWPKRLLHDECITYSTLLAQSP